MTRYAYTAPAAPLGYHPAAQPSAGSALDAAAYRAFLEAKVPRPQAQGFIVDPADIHPRLHDKAHQALIVQALCRGGRRACFAKFGLGKSVIQLETVRLAVKHAKDSGLPLPAGATAHAGLIVAPLGVRGEFIRDAAMLGLSVKFINSPAELFGSDLYITNYEPIRDGKLDPRLFTATSLDEADVLRGFGGSKTFREFMRLFETVRFRFVATATPSPNEFIEFLAYAAYLGIMEVGEGKTRFFKRNSAKADELTLHPHKEREFWLWVASWAVVVQRPSDLGCSDEGYDLPPVTVNWHEVADGRSAEEPEHWGQRRMFAEDAVGVVGAARVKRATIGRRLDKAVSLLKARPDDHCILWHDLEAEREALEQAIPVAGLSPVISVWGNQDLKSREDCIAYFSEGLFQYLAAKPVLAGAGCNFQRHCAWAIFLGVGFKFRDFIQAIHRIVRFLQQRDVTIDIVHADSERAVVAELKRKWAQHIEMEERMSEIIRQYGLGELALAETLARSIVDPDKDRVEISGPGYRLVRNDCIHELSRMADDSVGLIVTSIPFGNQYEYSPTFNDLGHTDDNAHFWAQMDFLIPQLWRVLAPGRVAVIHVKDRIVPGGINGLGFQTVYRFSDDCCAAFEKHGFAMISRVTSNTDVVKENNQTYRLAYGEQLRDGSRMGHGMPEYILKFRKPPSDLSNGYADLPVVKQRPRHVDRETGAGVAFDQDAWRGGKIRPVVGDEGYSLARWQVDASGVYRSSGDGLVGLGELARQVAWQRLGEGEKAGLQPPEDYAVTPLDLAVGMEAGNLFKVWRRSCFDEIYRYEFHVAVGETLAFHGRLPSDFTLLPPHSLHPEVWTDVMQARGMNTLQAAANREKHLCPLPFDIVERAIRGHSMPGETVLDPFGGLMTVPYLAVKMGRAGIGVELNADYFRDGCGYVEAAARERDVPGLFQWLGIDPVEEGMVQDEGVGVAA